MIMQNAHSSSPHSSRRILISSSTMDTRSISVLFAPSACAMPSCSSLAPHAILILRAVYHFICGFDRRRRTPFACYSHSRIDSHMDPLPSGILACTRVTLFYRCLIPVHEQLIKSYIITIFNTVPQRIRIELACPLQLRERTEPIVNPRARARLLTTAILAAESRRYRSRSLAMAPRGALNRD
jgi:hypothetical protein